MMRTLPGSAAACSVLAPLWMLGVAVVFAPLAAGDPTERLSDAELAQLDEQLLAVQRSTATINPSLLEARIRQLDTGQILARAQSFVDVEALEDCISRRSLERNFVRNCASGMVLTAVRRLQAEQAILEEQSRRQYLGMLANQTRGSAPPPPMAGSLSTSFERVGRRRLAHDDTLDFELVQGEGPKPVGNELLSDRELSAMAASLRRQMRTEDSA